MVNVTIYRLKDNRISAFTVSGHADFAEHGKDIVCAGVSAITVGAVNAIDQLCGISASEYAEMEHGYLHYYLPDDNEEVYEKAQLLLEGMVVSLQSIALSYGKYIKICEQLQEVQ